jgi:hypothetical protein
MQNLKAVAMGMATARALSGQISPTPTQPQPAFCYGLGEIRKYRCFFGQVKDDEENQNSGSEGNFGKILSLRSRTGVACVVVASLGTECRVPSVRPVELDLRFLPASS